MALDYHFDLYPRTNPNGARLVRFTNLQAAEYRGEANGTGAGRFSIRATDAEAAFIDPDGLQYVRVVRDDGATELVVGGFFLDSGEYAALDEDTTKLLTWGGAGTLSYLGRAVMDADSWIDDPFIGTDPQPEGVWPLHLAGTGNELGAILWRVLHEVEEPGRHQDPLPLMTLGFTHLVDSNAAAWVRTTGDFTAQVSENVISIVRRLMQMGLYVEVDPDDFEVRAYEPETHRRDRTGGAWGANVVRFQAPTDGTIATGNVKSDSRIALEAKVRRNAVLVGAQDIWEWVTDPAVDVLWEGGYVVDDDSGSALLKIGEAQLAARGEAAKVPRLRFKLGADPTNGAYLPFEHVRVDDVVTVHEGTGPWDLNEAEFPVAALTVVLRPGGDWDAWADLGSTYLSMAERAFQAQPVGAHTHPPNPQLCRPGTAPTFIRGAGSEGGTADGFTMMGAVGETLYAYILERVGFPTTICRWDPDDIALPDQDFTFLARITNGESIIAVYRLLAPGLGPGQVECSIGTGSVYMGAHHVIGRVSEVVTTNSGSSGASSVTASATGGQIILDAAGLTLFSVGGSPAPPTPGGGQTQDWALSWGTTDSVEWGGSHGGNNPTWTWDTAAPWAAAAIVVSGSSTGDLPQPVGANDEAAVGTSIRASRCDHVHAHSDLSDHSDEIHHHADSIEGLSSGAPTTADYLVGTAQAGLSAEIVVGTTPGGELGGTWASPTVDATHSGSTHSAATDTHIADTTDAHDASAVSVLDTGGNFTGTDVEAVLAELDAAIAGGASDLDDLTDVTISAPAEDDDLRYNGSQWVNDARKWEAVTDGEDVFVWDGDDLVHEWKAY